MPKKYAYYDAKGNLIGVFELDVLAQGSYAKKKTVPADFVPTPTLAQTKSDKLAELQAAYQAALEAGVTYQGATFESDEHSQLELAKVLTAIANGWALPAGFAWIDANNQPHPVPNVAWLQGLAQALADHKAACFARLQAAKSKVRTAKTVKAVQAVVF